jgi:thermitase
MTRSNFILTSVSTTPKTRPSAHAAGLGLILMTSLFGASPLSLPWAEAGDASVLHLSTELPPTDAFVRFRDECGAEQRRALLSEAQLQIQWTSELVPGLHRVAPRSSGRQVQAPLKPQRVADLQQSDCVLYAEFNPRAHTVLLPPVPSRVQRSKDFALQSSSNLGEPPTEGRPPNDPKLSDQWSLIGSHGIQAQEAWKITTGSANIKVAVIDTGLDTTHPEFIDRVGEGYDFIANTPVITDGHGHGTHVSGIIGARTNNQLGIAGINSEVTLLPLRAVPSNGDETDQQVIDAFEFAATRGARVANCSFGKKSSSQAVGDVIAAAGERGVLTVVAAGNDGKDLNQNPHYPSNFRTPNMIVVSAINEAGRLAGFSNYGVGIADLAAPGADILSTLPGGQYDSWDGTSMATPQVAGIAALVFAANPSLSVSEAKQILLSTVIVDNAFRSKLTTSGRIDAGRAVALAVQH